jgi:hypothetical protein
MYQHFRHIEGMFRDLPSIRRRPHLRVQASTGRGNWSNVPWIAVMDERETKTTRKGVYIVYLFRQDLSAVLLTLNQGVTTVQGKHGTKEGRRILRQRATQLAALVPNESVASGFQPGAQIDLRTDSNLGRAYENSTASFKLYETGAVPPDEALVNDLEVLLTAYDAYMDSDLRRSFSADDDDSRDAGTGSEVVAQEAEHESAVPSSDFSIADALEHLISFVSSRGFVFEPWQIAQYVTALRTKPFVILAGITGTGKSKLPRLVAEATGGESELVPVRPDWTDSSEVLGYVDLEGTFRPGRVLEVAHRAASEEDVHQLLIIDEMNIARVEHYFAEVLSKIEDRRPAAGGGWHSSPLIQAALREEDSEWGEVRIPSNLAIVGTVNMDESSHGFSRKVLDRAFTLELSDVDLSYGIPTVTSGQVDAPSTGTKQHPLTWPVATWRPRATRLSELARISAEDAALIARAVRALINLNQLLSPAQLQVGYRTRDEVALFLLHAEEICSYFRTSSGAAVDPLDLAILMKVLPRITGGSTGIRRVLLGIMGWAKEERPFNSDDDAREMLDQWEAEGRPGRLDGTRYPAVAARTCLMWDRLMAEGFTSYWL